MRLTNGTYVTGTLWLRSGVTLRLDKGAVLKGSRDFARYDTSLGPNRIALLQACGATNIAVVGEGVIDGNGQASPYRLWKKRWKIFYCADCQGVRVEGVRVLGANSWTMYFDRVDGVRVKDVVIRSRQSGCRDCGELHNGYVRVYKFEEKQSDVNLAVQAVHDEALNLADSYVIVTGDSDQVGTILSMCKDFGKQVIVLNPHEANSLELKMAATFYKNIPRDLPARCQLPDEIPVGTHGNVIRRPGAWK